MTRTHKIEAWIALFVAIALAVSTFALIRWQRQKALSLRGAIIIQDSDPRKQLPIAGVTVSAGDLAAAPYTSNSLGFFALKLRKPIRQGHPIVLQFRHPQYHPLDLNEVVSDKLYIIHMVPLSNAPPSSKQPEVKVSNIRVRYTVKGMSEFNVGSAVKTFEIVNKGNVPCNNQRPCSPDGKWKAAEGTATLDAGPDNEFREARVSCIAGPCPFTKIEMDHFSEGGKTISVTAINWSDTVSFVLESEVFRHMVSQSEHWSYPVIFGEGLSFTLPSTAGSVSIEADLDGQTIIFPLGPSVFLSWASCDGEINPNKTQVYRCAPKPGYTFQ